jgi:hypothetical protein
MFRVSSYPSSGATKTALAASGLLSEIGDSSDVGRGPTVKPEAASAVVELLMMDTRLPETC